MKLAEEDWIRRAPYIPEELWHKVGVINSIIRYQTSYGLREEVATLDSLLLHWSNAQRKWLLYTPLVFDPKTGKYVLKTEFLIKRGEVVKCDANEILIPFADKENVEKALPYLMPLPLYFLSSEAKMRGEAPPLLGLMWARKQLEKVVDEEVRRRLK